MPRKKEVARGGVLVWLGGYLGRRGVRQRMRKVAKEVFGAVVVGSSVWSLGGRAALLCTVGPGL